MVSGFLYFQITIFKLLYFEMDINPIGLTINM